MILYRAPLQESPMNPAATLAPQRTLPGMDDRTRRLLQGRIVPTLLLLAWPNVLVMTAQASTGLIETWWVSRLGIDALTGMGAGVPGLPDDDDAVREARWVAASPRPSPARSAAAGLGWRTSWCCTRWSSTPASAWPAPALFLLFGRPLLRRDGRPGRVARRGGRLLERGVRRHHPRLADECAGQRHPGHRQHAGAVAGDLRPASSCWCHSRRC